MFLPHHLRAFARDGEGKDMPRSYGVATVASAAFAADA
jgi:hypothetical protein